MAVFKPTGFFPLLLVLAATTLTACVYEPYYRAPYERWPHHYHYPHYYDYYYYPTIDVYFRYSTGDYYYRLDKKWVHSKQLPLKYRLDPRDRVIVRVPNDKPYKRYPEHQRDFKPYSDYRRDKEIDHKEREYHQRWHKEYLKRQQKTRQQRDYKK